MTHVQSIRLIPWSLLVEVSRMHIALHGSEPSSCYVQHPQKLPAPEHLPKSHLANNIFLSHARFVSLHGLPILQGSFTTCGATAKVLPDKHVALEMLNHALQTLSLCQRRKIGCRTGIIIPKEATKQNAVIALHEVRPRTPPCPKSNLILLSLLPRNNSFSDAESRRRKQYRL